MSMLCDTTFLNSTAAIQRRIVHDYSLVAYLGHTSLRELSVQAVKLIILRFDDLIPEESDVVLTAIKRLPSKEAYDRTFRIRRAFQVRLRPVHPGYQR
jgi:hypothetical protein